MLMIGFIGFEERQLLSQFSNLASVRRPYSSQPDVYVGSDKMASCVFCYQYLSREGRTEAKF